MFVGAPGDFKAQTVQAFENLKAALEAVGANFGAALDESGTLTVTVRGFVSSRYLRFFHPWGGPIYTDLPASTTGATLRAPSAMPKAYVPIFTGSRVYITQGDYASVPAVPTPGAEWPSYHGEVYYCLVMEDSNNRASRRVARITGAGSSGGAYYLVCDALNAPSTTVAGYYAGLYLAPTDRGGPRRAGFVISEPTVARLGLYTKADTWVKALQFAMETLGPEFASVIGAIDFDHIATVAGQYPSALRGSREYVLDLDATPLEILANEAALNGFALVMRNGKVSIARIAEFALEQAFNSFEEQYGNPDERVMVLSLREDVLPALGLTVTEAAAQLGVTRAALSRVLNGRAAISPEMALRLEGWLGVENGGSADAWIAQQAAYDLWQARAEGSPKINQHAKT